MTSVNELNAEKRGYERGLTKAANIANTVLINYQNEEVEYDHAVEASEAIRNLIVMEISKL